MRAATQPDGAYCVAELCKADSDEDGKTNGEELGDPCCVWKPASLSTVGKDYRISHPGHAQDVTDSPGPSAAECQALVRSQGAAEAFNETEWVDSMYNPGEDRLNATFTCASPQDMLFVMMSLLQMHTRHGAQQV
jgi:hypothetical protein